MVLPQIKVTRLISVIYLRCLITCFNENTFYDSEKKLISSCDGLRRISVHIPLVDFAAELTSRHQSPEWIQGVDPRHLCSVMWWHVTCHLWCITPKVFASGAVVQIAKDNTQDVLQGQLLISLFMQVLIIQLLLQVLAIKEEEKTSGLNLNKANMRFVATACKSGCLHK